LEKRFDALVEQRTGSPSRNGVLQEMREHQADGLRVLERPEVPLHTNAVASDIREYVQRRKSSGGTRSAAGRRCRDTFASWKKTCRTLGVRFWDDLHDRVRGRGRLPRLAALIREQAQEATATTVVAVPAGEPGGEHGSSATAFPCPASDPAHIVLLTPSLCEATKKLTNTG
jgi:hypothetical protein